MAAKAVAEAASQAAIDAEYIASIPEELKARMQAALSRETVRRRSWEACMHDGCLCAGVCMESGSRGTLVCAPAAG